MDKEKLQSKLSVDVREKYMCLRHTEANLRHAHKVGLVTDQFLAMGLKEIRELYEGLVKKEVEEEKKEEKKDSSFDGPSSLEWKDEYEITEGQYHFWVAPLYKRIAMLELELEAGLRNT